MSGYVDMKKREKDEQHAGRRIRKVVKAWRSVLGLRVKVARLVGGLEVCSGFRN